MYKRFVFTIIIIICITITSCTNPQNNQVVISTATQSVASTLTSESTTSIDLFEISPSPEPDYSEGVQALSFGDYDTALEIFSQTHTANTDDLKAASLFGQALAYYRKLEYTQAISFLENLIDLFPDTLPGKRAYGLLALINTDQDQFEAALQLWQSYLMARTGIIDAFVFEQIGDLYVALDQYDHALETYKQAYVSPGVTENDALAQKIAGCYEELGQLDDAIPVYKEIYFKSDNAFQKAQMDLLLGRLMLKKGFIDDAYIFFQDAVNNFPEAYDSYSALVALVNAGQVVDELKRGLINYYVGQYDLAIEAFERYKSSPGEEKDKAMYYQALAIRASGLLKADLLSQERFDWNSQGGTTEDNGAVKLWTELIEQYPQSAYLQDAIEDIVYTQDTYMGNTAKAIQTALDQVAKLPQASYAPNLLFTAGRYYEMQGKPEKAVEIWERIGIDYPSSDQSFQGVFFAGILNFRLGEMEKAFRSFNRSLLLSIEPLETAASYLWLGKTIHEQGDENRAIQYWNNALKSDPSGYYGLRAGELLENKPIFSAPTQLSLDVDMDQARLTASSWLRTAFNLSPQINLDYGSELYNDPRFIRGEEYHKLGLYTQARNEFEALRNEKSSDPTDTFRLIKVFLEKGLNHSAIEAARTIIKLAGYSEPAYADNVPDYLNYVQYGVYYRPWVENASRRYEVPILFLLSVIFQESQFDGLQQSSAGAQGLMQLIPATARQIAVEINYPPNFKDSDLFVPFFNLTLGTNYLSRQIFVFEGDYYAALAAYNSGPGNALAWKSLAINDPDLFLGSVRFLETRTYIRKIVEIYAQYIRIYGK